MTTPHLSFTYHNILTASRNIVCLAIVTCLSVQQAGAQSYSESFDYPWIPQNNGFIVDSGADDYGSIPNSSNAPSNTGLFDGGESPFPNQAQYSGVSATFVAPIVERFDLNRGPVTLKGVFFNTNIDDSCPGGIANCPGVRNESYVWFGPGITTLGNPSAGAVGSGSNISFIAREGVQFGGSTDFGVTIFDHGDDVTATSNNFLSTPDFLPDREWFEMGATLEIVNEELQMTGFINNVVYPSVILGPATNFPWISDMRTGIGVDDLADSFMATQELSCTFDSENILCEIETDQTTDNFVVIGDLTNLQDLPVNHVLLPPSETTPAGVEVCFGDDSNTLTLDPPLNNGDSFTFGASNNDDAVIIKNAQPGDEVCFVIIGFNEIEGECCRVDVCIEMPPCDCLQIDTRLDQFENIVCNDDGTVDFDYTFQLTNLFGQDVYHSFLIPDGDEVFDTDFFDLFAENGNMPLQHAGSVFPLTTRIRGAQPDTSVSFLVIIHNEDFSECCSITHEVQVPNCTEEIQDVLKGDVNGDGVVDLLDVAPFVDAVLTGIYIPEADANCDGGVNLLDVSPFIALLQQ